MAREARVEFEGAVYHVMDRGDRREAILGDDTDRERFLLTPGEVCGRTGMAGACLCVDEQSLPSATGDHEAARFQTPRCDGKLTAGAPAFLAGALRGFGGRLQGIAQNLTL